MRATGMMAVALLMARPSLADPPLIQDTVPRAVRPGRGMEFAIAGNHLEPVTRIWTSFPARCEPIPAGETAAAEATAGPLRCRLTVSRDEPVGIGAIRVVTREGVSPWHLVMIDDLPTSAESADHASRETAQPIPLSIAIDGTTDSLQSDFFRLEVTAPSDLACEVVAQRLGSQLDPVVTLYNDQGEPMAASDDEPETGADSRFVVHFDHPGTYYLALRDVRYRGGADFRYHLRVGRFPLLTSAFPLGGHRESVTDFQLQGRLTQELAPQSLFVQSPSLHATEQLLSVVLPGGDASGFVSIAVGDEGELLELEPNNAITEPTAIAGGRPQVERQLNGRCDPAGDIDYFAFDAEKDQHLLFRSESRQLGSPAEVYLRLWNSANTMVAEATSNGKDGAQLAYTIPESGKYCVSIEDLLQQGGPEYAYRVRMQLGAPTFALTTNSDTFTVPRGGTLAIPVTAVRHGYTGPISLSLSGFGEVGERLVCRDTTIPEGKNEAVFQATLPDDLDSGGLYQAFLSGSAVTAKSAVTATNEDGAAANDTAPNGTQGVASYVASVSTLPALRARMADATRVPRFLDGQLAVGIGPAFPPFYTLQVESQSVYFGTLGGKSTFTVTAQRVVEGFKDPIQLTVSGLPDQFVAEVKPIEAGKTSTVVTLTGPKELAAGTHMISIQGQAAYQYQPQTVDLAQVPLHIVTPLRVTGAPAGGLTVNQPQKMTVRVQRFGDERHPVTISWKSAPDGLLAPIGLRIPEDQDALEFTVLATAAAGTDSEPASVTLTASTELQGQTIVVDSDPIALPIQGMPTEGT